MAFRQSDRGTTEDANIQLPGQISVEELLKEGNMNNEPERLRRDEMNAIIYLRCALASAEYFRKDLQKRLTMIPDRAERFQKAMDGLTSVVDEIIATAPEESARRLANITHDFKIVLAPKPQTEPKRLILDMNDANTVMEQALKPCRNCFKSDDEARRMCRFYKVMETYYPLNDYGNGTMCQYGKSEIE